MSHIAHIYRLATGYIGLNIEIALNLLYLPIEQKLSIRGIGIFIIARFGHLLLVGQGHNLVLGQRTVIDANITYLARHRIIVFGEITKVVLGGTECGYVANDFGCTH